MELDGKFKLSLDVHGPTVKHQWCQYISYDVLIGLAGLRMPAPSTILASFPGFIAFRRSKRDKAWERG